MNENLKTRREHLKVLPLQKRLQAMEEIRKTDFFENMLNYKCDLYSTVYGSFTFEYTKKGHDYWMGIHNKYFNS